MSIGSLLVSIVGFLIVVYVLWRYAVPPVRRMMHKEQEAVRQQIRDAEAATQRLQEAEAKYRDAVENARTEAARIRDTARADAQRIVEEMRERAEREMERIKESGEEQLATQRQQIVRELHAQIGELSTELAGKLVDDHLSDPANRAASVDRFLDELESMSASGSSGGNDTGRAAGSKGDG